MTDLTFEARLVDRPELRAAIERRLAAGELDGLDVFPTRQPGTNPLESAERSGGREALEAIIQRFGRPPLLVQNDRVEIGPDDLVDFPASTDAQIGGTEADLPSVGRIEFVNSDMSWGGTGWVLAAEGNDRIVVTNRHVASLVARRTVSGKGVFLKTPNLVKRGVRIDFKEELGSTPNDPAHTFDVVDIPYLADTAAPDVALLRVAGSGPGLPMPLVLADAAPAVDDLVALIGYPAFDDRNDVGVMAQYFRDLYDVKRYAPGRVIQAQGSGAVLKHDCTSLGGNSGSPLIRLRDGAVVGLHFAGVFGVENSAVSAATLRDLLDGKRPITVGLGTTVEAAESVKDGVHDPAHFAGREGYDPEFLGAGLAAPWPGLPAAVEADLATPSDGSAGRTHELRYTHFGVKVSVSRRQPLMTAVNIDGEQKVTIKRGRDQWFRDDRIPAAAQLRKEDYADLDIDRGHLVRREDPNWGTRPVAEEANVDTFHYTNAAVQHGDFNSGPWLGLEDHILKSAATHGFRACVFTGPINRDDDEPIADGVVAPREFWKVVVMEHADTGRLHATAYLLSQGQLIHDLVMARGRNEGLEGFVLGPYKTYQLAIRDLADATGYDLSSFVAADPLAAAGGDEAVTSGEPVYLPLDGLEQLVL